MIRSAVRIAGVGVVRAPDNELPGVESHADHLHAVLAALSKDGMPIRLFHAVEEMAVVAGHEALSRAGVAIPYRGDDIGITLGVEEGIDGIKARYYQGILRDGPLGASPIAFPFTTPNTIAARLSILFDLRGEVLTMAGGNLAGAHALGLALQTIRDGRAEMVLAGGVTSVEQEFLDTMSHVRSSRNGQLDGAACLLLLAPRGSDDAADGRGDVLGYGQGFGAKAILDAIQACLEDARVSPSTIESVRTAAIDDPRAAIQAAREAGVSAAMVRSSASSFYSVSFPLAVAEAAGGPRPEGGRLAVVLGTDCIAGAAAAIVRGGA